jgi:UDP-glucose:(heptosyl)LPS alpha-1,3-glucosyltransferase
MCSEPPNEKIKPGALPSSSGRRALRVTVAAHEIGYDGGQERVTAELIAGLLKRGYDVTAVAWRCDIEPHPKLHFRRVHGPRRPASLASLLFYVIGSLQVWRDRGDLRQAAGAVVINAVDVTTAHFCNHYFQTAIGIKRQSRPGLVYRANEMLYNLLARAGERWNYRPTRTRRLVPVSAGLARELDRFFPSMHERITVIPNGVDRELFSPDPRARVEVRATLGVPEAALAAVFLGGDWERKGLRHAIGALAHAAEWRLLVVGDGDVETFSRAAVEIGVEGRLHFTGKRLDSWRYLAAADAFVLPTLYEAFPLSALEAASAGLPLVCTCVNGIEELIVDGENGFFVEADALAVGDGLARLGADPELRARMSYEARESTRRYSWPDIVDAYVRLLRELEQPGMD